MEPTKFMFDLPINKSSTIKVIGVGGGGSNAVNYMYNEGISGVDFVVCNTDVQALNTSPVPNKIQLGQSVTEGLGAGANPEVGEQAALESLEEIKSILSNQTKMVFITAGMGGGTGTGAAPIIAGMAKEMGLLTVGIVTSPFTFEGKMRLSAAEKGITKLRQNVDSLIVVNNDKLRETFGNLGRKEGFAKADEVLAAASKGIAEVISKHYSTNIDLRDAKTVLSNSGTAIMGSATASGENRSIEAISTALNSPLLNDNKITGAKNVLLLIVSGEEDITIDEIGCINDYIQREAGHQANIIMGIGDDETLGDKISVTVIATGFPLDSQKYAGFGEQKIVHKLESDEEYTEKVALQEKIEFKKEEKPIEVAPKKNNIEFSITNLEETESRENDFDDYMYNLNIKNPEPKTDFFKPLTDNKYNLEDSTKKSLETSKNRIVIKDEDNDFFVPRKEIKEEQTSFLPDLDVITQKISERRKRLKKFNFRFQSEKEVEEREKVPAFKRQGLDLLIPEDNSPSDLRMARDSYGEDQLRPNNFLHDNVD